MISILLLQMEICDKIYFKITKPCAVVWEWYYLFYNWDSGKDWVKESLIYYIECPKLQAFSKDIFESCTLYHIMPFDKIIGPIKKSRTDRFILDLKFEIIPPWIYEKKRLCDFIMYLVANFHWKMQYRKMFKNYFVYYFI